MNRINYGVTGADRKRLADMISNHLHIPKVYAGLPTYAYTIGDVTVDRDGTVSWEGEKEGLLDAITAAGFEPKTEKNAETTGLIIFLPAMPPDAMERLQRMINARELLIRKAVNADNLEVRIEGDKVAFPWWNTLPEMDETTAYTAFFAALCRKARKATRVTATERPVESEKYAFRIFLLQLGLGGTDNKTVRFHLMKRLSGHAAFRNDAEALKFRERRKGM